MKKQTILKLFLLFMLSPAITSQTYASEIIEGHLFTGVTSEQSSGSYRPVGDMVLGTPTFAGSPQISGIASSGTVLGVSPIASDAEDTSYSSDGQAFMPRSPNLAIADPSEESAPLAIEIQTLPGDTSSVQITTADSGAGVMTWFWSILILLLVIAVVTYTYMRYREEIEIQKIK